MTCAAGGWLLVAAGCGGGGSGASTVASISVSLSVSTIYVSQDGVPTNVNIKINSTSETAQVAIGGLPANVRYKYAASDTNPSGLLTFMASSLAPTGTYTPTITVVSAGQTASIQFTLVVEAIAK